MIIIIVLFVETPRKFITAKLIITGVIYYNTSNNILAYYYCKAYLRGVSTNKTIIYFIAMQTYKELNMIIYDLL
jgi:hypothetical protein